MAKETKGGVWINVNSKDKKGYVNMYGSDPKKPHNDSIHINIDYEKKTFKINEKSNGEKTSTDCNCYLTTACMKHYKDEFDDNCYYLDILRWFRDNYVSKEDIRLYYDIAPKVVSSLELLSNNDDIYKDIYYKVIYVCVKYIEYGRYDEAYDLYKKSVLELENNYVKSRKLYLLTFGM